MRKLLYLTTWDFENESSDGVCKKIKYQIATFEKSDFQVDFIYVKGRDLIYRQNGENIVIASLGVIKKTPAYYKMYSYLKDKQYDYVYNRFGMFDSFYCRVLKVLHNNGAKIILEVPTYPYKYEQNAGLLNWIMFKWDEICQKNISKYVDVIATFTFDEKIWNIPTLHIQNGIIVDDIKQKKVRIPEADRVILIAVALLQISHGYERILKGMYEYYQTDRPRKVYFNIVGDGPERPYYESLVDEYQLREYVTFWGRKTTDEMNAIFDSSDIGVCSLGAYKKKLYLSSELKSKEFMARGIPFIYGCTLDIEDVLDESIAVKYSNDDTPISIKSVIDFYDRIKEEYKSISDRMRTIANEEVDIKNAIKPILEYMEN